jgi:hypothetical protein
MCEFIFGASPSQTYPSKTTQNIYLTSGILCKLLQKIWSERLRLQISTRQGKTKNLDEANLQDCCKSKQEPWLRKHRLHRWTPKKSHRGDRGLTAALPAQLRTLAAKQRQNFRDRSRSGPEDLLTAIGVLKHYKAFLGSLLPVQKNRKSLFLLNTTCYPSTDLDWALQSECYRTE